MKESPLEVKREVLEAQLALEYVEDLLALIGGIQKAEDDTKPYELDVFDLLWRRWKKQFRGSLDGRLKRQFDKLSREDSIEHTGKPDHPLRIRQGVLDEFHEAAKDPLSREFLDRVAPGTERAINDLYRATRGATGRRLGVRFGFDDEDEENLTFLKSNSLYWVRSHYGDDVAPDLDALANEAVNLGLGRKEFAEELKGRFNGRFGESMHYWRILAGATMTRARSFSQVFTYEQIGIEDYWIENGMDERTCSICRFIVEQSPYSVTRAVEIIREVREAKDPEAVKSAMPWARWDEDASLPYVKQRDGSRRHLRNSEDLAAAGVQLPSFHGLCRCTTRVEISDDVRPISSEKIEIVGVEKAKARMSQEEDGGVSLKLRNGDRVLPREYEKARSGRDPKVLRKAVSEVEKKGFRGFRALNLPMKTYGGQSGGFMYRDNALEEIFVCGGNSMRTIMRKSKRLIRDTIGSLELLGHSTDEALGMLDALSEVRLQEHTILHEIGHILFGRGFNTFRPTSAGRHVFGVYLSKLHEIGVVPPLGADPTLFFNEILAEDFAQLFGSGARPNYYTAEPDFIHPEKKRERLSILSGVLRTKLDFCRQYGNFIDRGEA